ncbi:hypothetical protein P4O66_009060 [Electrophorus voltai]|uniref:Secreted protein n=1 Tax=Electrophorus voltai TaxID=2609070 RepID=A0AAD8ZAZ4_9TELE|nr:hypothetical protein P4O66_009060 [Electrophorus voltai]
MFVYRLWFCFVASGLRLVQTSDGAASEVPWHRGHKSEMSPCFSLHICLTELAEKENARTCRGNNLSRALFEKMIRPCKQTRLTFMLPEEGLLLMGWSSAGALVSTSKSLIMGLELVRVFSTVAGFIRASKNFMTWAERAIGAAGQSPSKIHDLAQLQRNDVPDHRPVKPTVQKTRKDVVVRDEEIKRKNNGEQKGQYRALIHSGAVSSC